MKNKINLLGVVGIILAFAASGFSQRVTGAQGGSAVLRTLDGTSVNVEEQRGKVVVLAIGATWLPLSKSQVLISNKLSRKFAGKDVLIYFVASDSTSMKSKNFASDEQIREFATKNRLATPILRDSDGAQTLRRFKIDQLPAFVILDKDGNRTQEAFSGLDPDIDATDSLAMQIAAEISKLL